MSRAHIYFSFSLADVINTVQWLSLCASQDGVHTKAFSLAAKVKILVNNFYSNEIEVIYQNLYFSS